MAEGQNRLTCSECSDRLRKKYGCSKPGYDIKGDFVFRSSSPILMKDKKPDTMDTCPIGVILKKSSYLFSGIEMATHSENGAVDMFRLSGWCREVIRIVQSERMRHREQKDKIRQSSGDAQLARSVA